MAQVRLKPSTRPRNGQIVTFYSYKGGTGRSMALANVAWILASAGNRVLTVDWDLEAPGLHRYFAPFLLDRDLLSSEGVIDFVIDYATEAMTPAGDREAVPKNWYVPHADITRYAASLKWEFPDGATLDFVPAGRQGPSYSTRVNTFDWSGFYERLGGGAFLEAMKSKLREEYDYVLIDSRTGVSDTSGICTVQLPDQIVVCFTLNNQSIEGASRIAAGITEQRRRPPFDSSPPLRILPVPMRTDPFEKDKLDARRGYARSKFALLPADVPDSERDAYWGAVEIGYVPYYAYEEVLAVFGDRPSDPKTLLASAVALARYLSHAAVTEYHPLEELLRNRIREQYAVVPGQRDQPDEVSQAAEQVFLHLSASDQGAVRTLFTRLVRVPPPEETGPITRIRLRVSELTESERAVVRVFAHANLLTVGAGTGDATVEICSDAILHGWHRLRNWLDEERDFLLWRQEVRSSVAQWERARRDSTGLLTGARLQAAEAWTPRWEGLSDNEREYLSASRTHRRTQKARFYLQFSVGVAAAAVAVFWVTRNRDERIRVEADAAVVRADSFSAIAQNDSARTWYQQAILLNETLPAAHFGMARLYALNSQADSAIGAYTTGLAHDPTNARALSGRGSAYLSRHAVREAIADYSRALDLGQRDPDTYFSRARAFEVARDTARALADFRQALALTQDPVLQRAARERMRLLGVRDSTPTSRVTRRVFVQYSDTSAAEDARFLIKALQSRGFTVLGPDQVREQSPGDVRYFFAADSAFADSLRTSVELAFASLGQRRRLRLVPLLSRRAPRGQVEVWLPSRLAIPIT